jgi:hypothetical protein
MLNRPMQTYEHLSATTLCSSVQPLEVKLFIHRDPAEAEQAISGWLRQHPVRVRHVAQSQSEKGGNFLFITSLYYTVRD